MACLADIFGANNQLNCQIQRNGVNIIEIEKKMNCFRKKLRLLWQQLENDNISNFPLLDELVSISNATLIVERSSNELQRSYKPTIAEHLEEWERFFEYYFPDRIEGSEIMICARMKLAVHILKSSWKSKGAAVATTRTLYHS